METNVNIHPHNADDEAGKVATSLSGLFPHCRNWKHDRPLHPQYGTTKPILSLATSSKRTEVPSSCTNSSNRASCHSPSRKVCNIPTGTSCQQGTHRCSAGSSGFMTIGVPTCANYFPNVARECLDRMGRYWEPWNRGKTKLELYIMLQSVAICCNAGRSSSCINWGSCAHTTMRLLLATPSNLSLSLSISVYIYI